MIKSAKSTKGFAYLRTSSAANIGEDKDSGRRQLHGIEAFAKRAGIELVGAFNDEAVKGSDPIDIRPGFAAMLDELEANGTKTIIVETANRFARDTTTTNRLRRSSATTGCSEPPLASIPTRWSASPGFRAFSVPVIVQE
jgi:DNA invertase Pin-like site-specific DNA recombinase